MLTRLGRSVSEPGARTAMANTKPSVWLYAHSSMEQVASAVVSRCEQYHATQRAADELTCTESRDCRHVEFKKTIKWDRFNDGFPNLFIEAVKEMAGRDVIYLASFHSPDVIFEQLSVIYAIPRYLARSFTIILPYFPTATMERVDTEGQIATAKTLATLLSSTPLTARGPSQLVVFDIHALQERFYFSETIIPRLESAIPLLLRELREISKGESLAIAFPDDGAYKRFHLTFQEWPTIVCFKIRDGAKRIVKIKDGDPSNKHVIIVDDLVQTGGTLIECAKALVNQGAKKISCYVTHAVFPRDSWQRFVDCKDVNIDKFYITDSLPHSCQIAQHRPFVLLSIADCIGDMLLGYDLLQ